MTLGTILAIVITILAALHITYSVTVNSVVPKISGAKQKAKAGADRQEAINQAVLTVLKDSGVDTTKLTTK